jgi:SAM-dependent methyltransferase
MRVLHESFMLQSSSPANRYGSIASEIYDIDKPPGRLPDTAFYLDRLNGVEGPILEPACGSGRAMLPLLQAGNDVTGFDASPDMLERCRALCSAHGFAPDISQQTFEGFSYDRRFGVIMMPMGSFTLIGDFAVAEAVLKRFFDHLRPGGLLLLDIQMLAMLAEERPDRRSWTAENGDLLTIEGQRVTTDWMRQRADYRIRYERWRDNKLIAAELEPMVQRYWGHEEMRLCLLKAGFTNIVLHPSFRRGDRPRQFDRTITFEAVRP